MRIKSALLLSALLPACVLAADAKAPKKHEDPHNNVTFMDAEKAGIDYAMQGEYEGSKWGAQVIAMGDGHFHAVFEPGGLPGAGWDAKNRFESEGKLEGDKVILHPTDKVAWEEGHIPPPVEIKKGFDAEISGETLTAKTDSGETITLKKTVRHSPTEGAKPPEGAIVLFDGSNVDHWKDTEVLPGNLMKEGGETKKSFADYRLHVEFFLPFKPFARSQGRGNSGVYNQHRYEIQVLDSFGVKGMDNQCGGIYTKNPPAVNMCYPPLTWQTYDIEFKAARYKDQKRVSDAEATVMHNGVLIQDHFKINGPTGGGKKEVPTDDIQTGPLYLQEHGNPVWYRNVWIVEKK
jgi:hypothetical protein